MSQRRASSRSRSSRGGGPSGAAVAFVVLIAATAVVIALNARSGGKQDAVVQQKPERKDIFADLPPDVPPERGSSTTTMLTDYENVPLPTDERSWNEATDYAARAEIALKEAIAAKNAGATDLAKKKGAEAQELYSRALQAANPWLASITAEYGSKDPLVVRVDRTTSEWAQEIVFLKKSAGM